MTAPAFLNVPDISEGIAVPDLASQDGIILRTSLGGTFEDHDYKAQLATIRSKYPGKPVATYVFLTGPKRGVAVQDQMAFYAAHQTKPAGAFIDWEEDRYKWHGIWRSYGHQPFASVLVAIEDARKLGLDPGVYGSLSLFTPAVVKALVDRHVPVLWVAAYGYPSLPDRIMKAGPIIGHQYTGTKLDRSRFYTSEDEWRAFCELDSTPVTATLPPPPSGHVVVREGTFWHYDVSGTKAAGYAVKRNSLSTGGFTANVGTIIELTWGGKPRRLARFLTGAYAGSWVDLNDQPSITFTAQE